jgi:hypothetical protein
LDNVDLLIKKYNINLEKTCGVFYRGLEKSKETDIAPHEVFIEKCREIKNKNNDVTFFVQTDETEFLLNFLKEFPNSIF